MTISPARSGNAFSWLRGKRSKLALASVSAAALALTIGAAATANADTRPTVLSVRPGGGTTPLACLDVVGGSTANGAPVQVYDCNDTPNQLFIITTENTMRSAATGKCLDVAGGATADGSKVQMYDCNGSEAQVWLQLETEPGAPTMRYNPHSNKCLNDPKGSLSGARVEIWACTGSNNQIWHQYTGV
ncbi:ricin-type beta-trefoil lectin domain protein [Streptomyces sp. NPDC048565]|uniref:RICIN domain-containing protein n=1 Tax=Streptomyces sp. NPDC048565 TaxID=3155266 RepID=UPI00344796B5